MVAPENMLPSEEFPDSGAEKACKTGGQETMRRYHDLEAACFRATEAMLGARREADEAYARGLDLEAQIQDLEAQVLDLGLRLGEARSQLDRMYGQLEKALQLLAGERKYFEQDRLRLQARIAHSYAVADSALELLRSILSSRSWVLTRPLRRLVGWSRGRPWREPELPVLGPDSDVQDAARTSEAGDIVSANEES